MKTVQTIDNTLLDQVSAAALASTRRRKNLNFHASDAAACHRLLNAIEPGSYIQPHRHLDPAKDETILLLRGKLGFVSFDGAGSVIDTCVLAAGGALLGLTVPSGVFHTLFALEPGCVFFESKAGPYQPLTPDEKAAWAPAEGESGATPYLSSLQALFA